MRKILLRIALVLSMLVVMTASASSWIQTNWPATNSYFSLYAAQNKVFARIWDTFNGGRVFLTADDGENWAQISSAEPDIDILSLVLLDSDILAGTWEGFYRSTDGGTTWNAVTPAGVPAGTAISSLALLDTTLYAGTTGDIFKSTDNGNTWTEVSTGIAAEARILSFLASEGAVYAGSASHGVFKTTNGGSSWAAVNSGITDLHISQLAVVGSRLFAVTLTGVFISDNGGTGWTADGSGLEDVNCLAVVGNQLYAGTDGSGVHLSLDSGATWTAVPTGMPAGSRVWSLAASGGYLFAGTDSGVWRVPVSITSYTITASAGAGGSISPAGAVTVYEGTSQTFAITPDVGFAVSDVLVDGGSVGAVGSYTFSGVTADHTIAASFYAVPTYTITASAGAGGTISPSGPVLVSEGSSQTFTITPDTGYSIASLTVDESPVPVASSYTFTNVTGGHTIAATFVLSPDTTIHKQVDMAAAGPGDTLTYTIQDIGHAKSDLLTSVTVVDTIPAGATYVADSDTPEATEGSGILTWNLGSNTAGVPGSATGAVSVAGPATSLGINNANSVTFSHTPGAGTNRLLLVGISWSGEGEDESYARTVTGVTFGGTPLTPVPGGTCYQSYNRRVAMYYLQETFSATAANVVVNFSGPVWAVAGAVTFAGVDQTTPLGTFSCGTGNSTTPSVTLTGLTGNELVFDTVAANNNLNNFGAGAGQSQQWNMNQQTDNSSGIRGAASTEQAAGSSVTMSWSTSNTTWAIGAVPVRPGGGSGRTTTLSAFNALVSTGDTITLEATFANLNADTNVTPGTPGVTGANGAACGSMSAATLISADDDISGSGDTVVYRWTCTASAGTALPSSVTVSVGATGGAYSYPPGTSNSVLVAPDLTFQVTVDNPPELCQIDNAATLDDSGAYIAPAASNTATTAVRRYALTAGSDGHGSVALDPSGGLYTCGETVTLTPVPADGYTFVGWVGTNAGEVLGDEITMDADRFVVANFAAGGNHPPTLVALVEPTDLAIRVDPLAPLRVTVADEDLNLVNVAFYVEDAGTAATASAQAFSLEGTAYAVVSGAEASISPHTLAERRTYHWYVEITDGAATARAPAGTDYWTFDTWDPTGVELASLAAYPGRGSILVQWETASEVDNLGFHVWRATSANGQRKRLTAQIIPGQAPGSTSGGHYQYLDETALPGLTCYYWVEQVGVDGLTDLHGPISAAALPYFKPLPGRE